MIRVFARAHAARQKPNLPFRRVHFQNFAHNPIAARNLIFQFARRDIIQIKLRPAVALAHPNQFAGIIQPLAPCFRFVIYKSFAVLLDHRAHRAVRRVDGENTIELMTALVVVEIKFIAARRPAKIHFAIRRKIIRK